MDTGLAPSPGPHPGGLKGNALLDAESAAARARVKRGTWTSYVARGQAPRPDERDLRTGSPRWRESTVDEWLAARPGQGARTDLRDRQ